MKLIVVFCVVLNFALIYANILAADILKFVYLHEELCGDLFSDPLWVPALERCSVECNFMDEICMRSVAAIASAEKCRRLPLICLAKMREDTGKQATTTSAFEITTQAPKLLSLSPKLQSLSPRKGNAAVSTNVIDEEDERDESEVEETTKHQPSHKVNRHLPGKSSHPSRMDHHPHHIIENVQENIGTELLGSSFISEDYTTVEPPFSHEMIDVDVGSLFKHKTQPITSPPRKASTQKFYFETVVRPSTSTSSPNRRDDSPLHRDSSPLHRDNSPLHSKLDIRPIYRAKAAPTLVAPYLPPPPPLRSELWAPLAMPQRPVFEWTDNTPADRIFGPPRFAAAAAPIFNAAVEEFVITTPQPPTTESHTTQATAWWLARTLPPPVTVPTTFGARSKYGKELLRIEEKPMNGNTVSVDLSRRCCRWALDGLCDRHWQRVRRLCPKSCGSVVCSTMNGANACNRVLSVDVVQCYQMAATEVPSAFWPFRPLAGAFAVEDEMRQWKYSPDDF